MKLPVDISQPAEADITNAPGARTGDLLVAVVKQFDLEHTARYQPRDLDGDGHNETMCNVFANDVTAALGCAVPRGDARHWLRANDQFDWLSSSAGLLSGWREVGRPAAAARAFIGFPVVVAYKAPSGPGHIALVMPAPPSLGLHVAQAGAHCSSSMPFASGFGALPVTFWTHP